MKGDYSDGFITSGRVGGAIYSMTDGRMGASQNTLLSPLAFGVELLDLGRGEFGVATEVNYESCSLGCPICLCV